MGRVNEALPYLERGLKDALSYRFALTDRDLNPIRETDVFKQMMEEAAKKFGDVKPIVRD